MNDVMTDVMTDNSIEPTPDTDLQESLDRALRLLNEKEVEVKSLRFAANQPRPLETALMAALRPAIRDLIDEAALDRHELERAVDVAVADAIDSRLDVAVADALDSRLEDLQIEVESTATIST